MCVLWRGNERNACFSSALHSTRPLSFERGAIWMEGFSPACSGLQVSAPAVPPSNRDSEVYEGRTTFTGCHSCFLRASCVSRVPAVRGCVPSVACMRGRRILFLLKLRVLCESLELFLIPWCAFVFCRLLKPSCISSYFGL